MCKYHHWGREKEEKPLFQSLVLMTNNQSLLRFPSLWIIGFYPCSWSTKVKSTKVYWKLTFQKSYFLLSGNKKNYSNEKESLKFLDEFILSYIQKKNLGPENQKEFGAQITDKVLKLLDGNNILVIKVPPNMTVTLTAWPYCQQGCKIFYEVNVFWLVHEAKSASG